MLKCNRNGSTEKRKVVVALRLLMHRFEPFHLRSFPLRKVLVEASKTPSGRYVETVRVQMLHWANHFDDTTPPYASPRLKKCGRAEDTAGNMSQDTSNRVTENATKLWTWACNACSYENTISSDKMTDTRYICGMCGTSTSVKQVQANIVVVEDEDVDYHDVSSGQESVPIRMYVDVSLSLSNTHTHTHT